MGKNRRRLSRAKSFYLKKNQEVERKRKVICTKLCSCTKIIIEYVCHMYVALSLH